MFTVGEQQELRQIEEGLRNTDHGFAWRLALFQGVLRWAAPGRRAYLPVLAVLAAALLRLVAAAGRLLLVFCRGGDAGGASDPPAGSRLHGVAGLVGQAAVGSHYQPAARPAAA